MAPGLIMAFCRLDGNPAKGDLRYNDFMDDLKPARVIRALTSDTRIRLAALDTRPLWDGVRRGHPQLEAEACACLTELLAGTLLLQSRFMFLERLQVMLRSDGRAKTMVADSWPDGSIRGVLDVKTDSMPDGSWFCPPGLLQVMRSTQKGEPITGNLPLVEGDIAAQIEAYLQHSEQVQASITLWCDPNTGEGGGLLVEPLPACPPERMESLIAALEGLEVVPHWERDPEFLFRWLNQGDGTKMLSTHEVIYQCRCDVKGLLNVLTKFSKEKLDEIFPGNEPAEMRCDYCGKHYLLHRQDVERGTTSA